MLPELPSLRWATLPLSLLLSSPSPATAQEYLPSPSPNTPLLDLPGGKNTAPIPNWKLQSTTFTGTDLAALSAPGVDTEEWHQIPTTHCTLMGCLLTTGLYDDGALFFSENLKTAVTEDFSVPWLYRHEFVIEAGGGTAGPRSGNHYFLTTHGITSRADLWLNGVEIASSSIQAGAYVGRKYDITSIINLPPTPGADVEPDEQGEKNVLVVQVYPTDYNYDFALGFVDWNPYPPDNGTGVWREIFVSKTGPVDMSSLLINTEIELPVEEAEEATVTLSSTARNLESREVEVMVDAIIYTEESSRGGEPQVVGRVTNTLTLAPLEEREISISVVLPNPMIWWPSQWGPQHLYIGELRFSVPIGENIDMADFRQTSVSDKKTFGIRTVTSSLNKDNDRAFEVNGHPFQVLAAGYSADMFLRFSPDKFTSQMQHVLSLGLNTIRLEGKNEQPFLYEITDRLGIMVMAGWECCDKWEAWEYNPDLGISPVPVWDDGDYAIANASLRHEVGGWLMQGKPSMLAFLVGSDFWPDDRATAAYMDTFEQVKWDVPVISSASQRGFPDEMGNSGMKMEGPYDWVPPNYWYHTSEGLGSASGFASELGAGVGTPELGSLRKFLTEHEMEAVWKGGDRDGMWHMSTEKSAFYDRGIYNTALEERYGKADSMGGYLVRAQMADYEATRAEFEAYASRWGRGGVAAEEQGDMRTATGLVYWMLNNAWPSLHWNLFDYYLHPGGSYFGAKVGCRQQHVSYDYVSGSVYMVDRSLTLNPGTRNMWVLSTVSSLDGDILGTRGAAVELEGANWAGVVMEDTRELLRGEDGGGDGVVLLKLELFTRDQDGGEGEEQALVSRNVYWLPADGGVDALDWEGSSWYHTPVSKFVDYSPLAEMEAVEVKITPSTASDVPGAGTIDAGGTGDNKMRLTVENLDESRPAVFVRLNLVYDGDGEEKKDGDDVVPVYWSDNYFTLFGGEAVEVEVQWGGNDEVRVEVSGGNVIEGSVVL